MPHDRLSRGYVVRGPFVLLNNRKPIARYTREWKLELVRGSVLAGDLTVVVALFRMKELLRQEGGAKDVGGS